MLGIQSDIKYCMCLQDLKSNFSTTNYLSSQLKKSLYYPTCFNSDYKSTPLSLCSKRIESLIYLPRRPRHPPWRPKPKPKSSTQELKVTPTISTRKIKPVPSLIHILPHYQGVDDISPRLRRCARDPPLPHKSFPSRLPALTRNSIILTLLSRRQPRPRPHRPVARRQTTQRRPKCT